MLAEARRYRMLSSAALTSFEYLEYLSVKTVRFTVAEDSSTVTSYAASIPSQAA